MQKRISFIIFFLATFTACAQLKLPALVADSMVLQRDQAVEIWGWNMSGGEVVVSFKNKIYKATPNKEKKWFVTLDPTEAGGPYSMDIHTDGHTLKISEVLFGDVWLCSGQSNMTMAMSSLVDRESEDIVRSENPNIREFQVKRQYSFEPKRDVSGDWKQASPTNVLRFSAVAYYMAKDLYEKYKVPIGIIHSSWGGTPAEAWLSVADLKEFPDHLEKYNFLRDTANLDATITRHKQSNDNTFRVHYQPATLFNAMISPLAPYTIKGFAWYQGEANAKRPEEYAELLPALIKGWRSCWQQDDLPFLIVQLANYMAPQNKPSEGGWAWIREAQLKTSQTVPNTALVVTIDIGDAKDIHPLNKKEVGRRLALAAQKVAYQDPNVVFSGPTYQSLTKEDHKIILSFTNVGSGLVEQNDQLTRFAIAGKDKRFVWASAKIEGDKVVVWNEEISDPQAVRYAWGSNPEGHNLYNKEGLPASPFRTDSWHR